MKIQTLIDVQTVEWTDLIGRQMTEQYSLSRQHLQNQLQLLSTLTQGIQQQQLADLQLKHQRYITNAP